MENQNPKLNPVVDEIVEETKSSEDQRVKELVEKEMLRLKEIENKKELEIEKVKEIQKTKDDDFKKLREEIKKLKEENKKLQPTLNPEEPPLVTNVKVVNKLEKEELPIGSLDKDGNVKYR